MRESEYLAGREQLLTKLGRLSFLSSIEHKYLKDIISRSKMRTYEPDEVITSEGTYDNWVYIILAGKVEVLKDGKKIACLDKPGDTFGEMALLDGKERSATIRSSCDTVCLAIDASILSSLDHDKCMAFYVVFYQLFAEILVCRLRETTEELAKVKAELEKLKNSDSGNSDFLEVN